MNMTDTLTLDGLRRTTDGYLVASVRAARTGIQTYTGAECGKPEMAIVRVYRAADQVFDKASLGSFAHRPVTVDHPNQAVTADNWKDYAVGQTGDEIARDGEFVRVPLVLMDAAAIKSVEDGKREISMGYSCNLAFADGVTPQGEAYDAVQTNVKINHLAIVSAARGGSKLKLGDVHTGETTMAEQALKTIIVDGLSVITTDAGAQAIDKLNGVIAAAAAKAVVDAKALSDAKAATDTKDGEIAALKKQLDDAKVTPAQLDAAVAARSQVIADARKIAGDKLVTDGKTDADIRRDAVATKLDAAAVKAMSDDAVAGAFVAFTPKVDGNAPLRDALSNIQTSDARAAATASWEKNKADLNNAWKGKAS